MASKFTDVFDREGPLGGSNGWTAIGNPANTAKHDLGTIKRRANPYYGQTYTPDPPYLHAAGPDHATFTVPTYWGQPLYNDPAKLGNGWGHPGGPNPAAQTPYPPYGQRSPHPYDGIYYTYVLEIGASQKGDIKPDLDLFQGDIRIGLSTGGEYVYPYTTWELNGVTYGHYPALVPYGGWVDMDVNDLPAGAKNNPATRVACWTQDGTLIDYYEFPDQRQYFVEVETFQGNGSAGIMRPLAKNPDGYWESAITFFADGIDRTFLGFADGELILCADSYDAATASCAVYLDWDNGGYLGVWYINSTGGHVLQGSVNSNSAEPDSFPYDFTKTPAAYPLTPFVYRMRIKADTGVVEVFINDVLQGHCTIPAAEWERYVALSAAKLGGLSLFQHDDGEEYMGLLKYESWVIPAGAIGGGPRDGSFVAPPY